MTMCRSSRTYSRQEWTSFKSHRLPRPELIWVTTRDNCLKWLSKPSQTNSSSKSINRLKLNLNSLYSIHLHNQLPLNHLNLPKRINLLSPHRQLYQIHSQNSQPRRNPCLSNQFKPLKIPFSQCLNPLFLSSIILPLSNRMRNSNLFSQMIHSLHLFNSSQIWN